MLYKLITKNSELLAEISNLNNAKYIAVDTEFSRQHSFWPKLCTLQMCYRNNYALVIDCLSDLNLNPLFDLLYNDKIIKIFHSAKQDLEIFLNLNNKLPKNIFDTQIAAMLINQPSGCSYKTLVFNLLNISLDKTQKMSDWNHRPLSQEQLQYAGYDVVYLYQIYQKIIHQLSISNKLDWLVDVFDDLTNEDNYRVNVEKHLSKIHNHSSSGLSYYIAMQLFSWREIKAQEANRPRNHILPLDSIKEISLIDSDNRELQMTTILQQFKNSNNNITQQYTVEIFDIIQEAYSKKDEDLYRCVPQKEQPLSKIQTILQLILKENLDTIAVKYNVNSNILAGDNDLKQLILYKHNANTKILKSWRYTLFGENFLEFLNEQKGIYLSNNMLSIK